MVWFLRKLALVIVALLAVTVGIAVVAPDTVLRFVAKRAAAWGNVETSGLDTLNVDLANAAISGGPLTFGRMPGEPARVGRFHADIDGSRLFTGRVVLEDVSVADADLKLTAAEDGSYTLNGIPLGPSGKTEEPETAGKAGGDDAMLVPPISIQKASIERLHVDITRAPDLSLPITIEQFRLSDLSPETPEMPAKFQLAGGARRVRLDYQGEAKVFTDPIDIAVDGGFENLTVGEIEALAGPLGLARGEGALASTGKHHVTVSRAGDIKATMDGSLTATSVDIATPDSIAVRLERGRVGLDAQATVTPDGRIGLTNRAPITIVGLVAAWSEKGSVKLATATVDVAAAATVATDQSADATVKGSVPLGGLVVAWSENGAVHLENGSAHVDLNIGLKPNGDMTIAGPMALQGERGGVWSGRSFKLTYQAIDAAYPDAVIALAADGTATIDGKPAANFADFAVDAPFKIGAARAVASSNSVHVVAPREGVLVEYDGTLALENAVTPIDEKSRLRMASTDYTLAGFSYDEAPSLAADLRSDIKVRAAGIGKEGEKGETTAPFPVRDAKVTVAGLDLNLTPEGGVGRVAVDPATRAVLEGTARGRPHRVSVGLERFEITDLDPSLPKQLTRVDMLAVVNDRGRIEVIEEVKPFSMPPEFVFNGKINGLELPDLSPYLAMLTGLNAESGRLSARGNAIAADGKVDGVLDVDIQTLDLVPAKKTGFDVTADLTGMPINIATAVLEDANRRIQVSLPFSGDVSSPHVHYWGVIWKALLGAVKLVVTQPLKALGQGGAGDALAPIPFEAGSATLTAEGMRQLEQMAGFLAKKPRLRLQVCGRATRADAVALGGARAGEAPPAASDPISAKMLALAQDRGRTVLERLGAAASVNADQVQQCRPTADPKDAGPPRTEARL